MMSLPRPKRHILLAGLAIIVAGLLPELIWPKQSFVYDDTGVFESNMIVKERDYAAIWSTPYWTGLNKAPEQENLHRPIFLTLAAMFQDKAIVLRWMLMLSHCMIGVLLWIILRKRTEEESGPWLALIGAALFTLHPANVEVTGQIIGLMEAVPTLLGLAAVMCLPHRPGLALVFAGITPGWKEIGYAWLGCYVLLALHQKKFVSAVLGVFVCCGWLYLRWSISGELFQNEHPPYVLINPLVQMSGWDAFFSRFALLGHHLRLFFFPHPLSSDYSRGTLPLPGYFLQIWVLLALGFLAYLYKNRKSVPLEAWITFATLLPTLHLAGPAGSIFGERYSYGFRMAMVIVVILGVQRLLKAGTPLAGSLRRNVILATMAIIVSAFFLKTVERHQDWLSDLRLFEKDLRTYPMGAKGRFNYAVAMGRHKMWEAVQEQLAIVLAQVPDFPEAHYRMGLVSRTLGDEKRAQFHWGMAHELGYPIPRKMPPLKIEVMPRGKVE